MTYDKGWQDLVIDGGDRINSVCPTLGVRLTSKDLVQMYRQITGSDLHKTYLNISAVSYFLSPPVQHCPIRNGLSVNEQPFVS